MEKPDRPSIRAIVTLIFTIAITTFASGVATIAIVGRRFQERQWIGPAQFDLCFTLSRTAPGTNVFAFVAAVCWTVRGWLGAFAGVLALSIPSAVCVLLLTLGYETFRDHPTGQRAIEAVLATVVGIMLAGAALLIRPRLQGFRPACILLFGLVAARWFSPLLVMVMAAVVGYFWTIEDPS